MKKIFLFLIFMSIALTSFAKNNEKRVILAFELYDKGKYEQSIKLIDSVLMSKGEDYETLTELAAANWCLSWIYKNTGYANKDIQKSYQFANTTLNYYNLIVSKYPYYRSQNTRQINDITVEMQELIRDYPGCNNEDAESRNAEKKTENISTENQNTTEKENTDKTVTITVSGSGKTQDEAKQSALRSAIEQAFGAFISAKTEILNDQVIFDQVTSVASGNIQSFDILNASQLPDGTWGMTLKALVSVDKLTSFVEAKGVTVEIKGGLFAFNIKQQILNEQAEFNAIYEMIGLLHEPMQTAFDYTIQAGDPKSIDANNVNWEIPLNISVLANKNMDFCSEYIFNTLKSISLTNNELDNYKKLNKKTYPVKVFYKGNEYVFYFRKSSTIIALYTFSNSLWNYYLIGFNVEPIDSNEIRVPDNDLFGRGGGGWTDGATVYNGFFINLFSSGQNVITFSWKDKKTLKQIEQMNEYTIKPTGIRTQYKNGGYLVNEINGHCLVVSLFDLDIGLKFLTVTNYPDEFVFTCYVDLEDAKTLCNGIQLGGYKDWHIPTIEELQIIENKLINNGFGTFTVEGPNYFKGRYNYIYFDPIKNEFSTYYINNKIDGDRGHNKSSGHLRLVRTF